MTTFKPFSTEELESNTGFLTLGDADFKVLSAVERVNKNNKKQIVLTLNVWDPHGKEGTLKCWLTFNSSHFCHLIIKRFCQAIGKGEYYETGNIPVEALVNRTGRCKLVEQEKDGKKYISVGEFYPADDEKHVTPEPSKPSKPKAEDVPFEEDDVPF